MKKQFAKLVNLKSMVTIIMVMVFAYLSINGDISPEQFLTVFTVVISFYFGTQYEKNIKQI